MKRCGKGKPACRKPTVGFPLFVQSVLFDEDFLAAYDVDAAGEAFECL